MKQIRKRLTYANVMSSIAVFAVLGGAAIAAGVVPTKSVGTNQLKAGAVKAGKLHKNAVTRAKIKNNAVDGSKIADGSVTGSKIADGSVTDSKIADGSVTGADIDAKARPSGASWRGSGAIRPWP